MAKIQDRIHEDSAVMPDGCWLWLKALTKAGYGKTWVDRRTQLAHRVSYEAFRGPIPDGKLLDHVFCDERSCVNPWHLEPATHRQNLLRSEVTVAGVNVRKTHCPQNHPLSGDNLRIIKRSNGKQFRSCKECSRRQQRAFQERRAAA